MRERRNSDAHVYVSLIHSASGGNRTPLASYMDMARIISWAVLDLLLFGRHWVACVYICFGDDMIVDFVSVFLMIDDEYTQGKKVKVK